MQHKKMKPVLSLIAVLVLGLFVIACNNGASEKKKASADTPAVKAADPAPAKPDTLKPKDTLDGKPTETSN